MGDALELPFADASFDRVMSICAIEHFDDGARALDEMTRVLVPGGELVMSADALTLAGQWPGLYRAHCERYHVQRTYSHADADRPPGRPRPRGDHVPVPVPEPVGAANVPRAVGLRG